MWIALLLACRPVPDPPRTVAVPEQPTPGYSEVLQGIALQRELLARQAPSSARRDQAKAVLSHSLEVVLKQHWEGTPWAFYGATETPGEGEIACGYLVSTVLRDIGLRVERVKLAQQPSALIARTTAGKERWLRNQPISAVVEAVAASQEPWTVVGLDYHVGLLHLRADGEVELCHSGYLAPTQVVCEPALDSASMVSQVHVLGPVFTDAVVDAWLEQAPIPTRN